MKPTVLLLSSKEELPFAQAIQAELQSHARTERWDQRTFTLSKAGLDSLVRKLGDVDYAICILTPIDIRHSRGTREWSPRDNVIFELGLALGILGSERVSFVAPAGLKDFHLPSDLSGVVAATYDASDVPDNPTAAKLKSVLSVPCVAIAEHIDNATDAIHEKLTARQIHLLLHMNEDEEYYPADRYWRALAHWDTAGDESPKQSWSKGEQNAWTKAAQYACSYLEQLGLVRHADNAAFIITERGKRLIASPRAKREFGEAYERPLHDKATATPKSKRSEAKPKGRATERQ